MSEKPRIEISPDMLFGQPHLSGHRLPPQMIAERYWHLGHELQTELLDFYEITRAEVLVCCWVTAKRGSAIWRKRWADWLEGTWSETHLDDGTGRATGWWGDWSTIDLPPTRADVQAARAGL